MIEPFGVWHPLVVIGEGTANDEQGLVSDEWRVTSCYLGWGERYVDLRTINGVSVRDLT